MFNLFKYNKNEINKLNYIKRFIFNKNNGNSNSSSSSSSSVGLLGIKELKTPNGWIELFEKKNERIQEIKEMILPNKISIKSNVNHLKETLYYVDEISQQLCDLMDPAQFTMNIVPNPQHKKKSQEAFLLMAETVNQLNANSQIYELLLSIRSHPEYSQLPNDHKLFLNEMIKESETNGINLLPHRKEDIMRLKDEILYHGNEFVRSSKTVHKYPPNFVIDIPYSKIKDHLPTSYLSQLSPQKPNGFVPFVPTDYLVDGILKYVPDPKIRSAAHSLQSMSKSYDPVIDHLTAMLEKRYQLAKTLGCNTFADYELKNKLLKTPQQVYQYLNELSDANKLKSNLELNQLIELKKKMEPENENNNLIYTYDLAFYKNLLTKDFYQSQSLDKEELSQYFSLGNVINGFNIIVNNLFGAELTIVPMEPGESWDPSVLKLVLSKKDEGILGILYLDPWENHEKSPGCINHPLSLGYKRHSKLFKNNDDVKPNSNYLDINEYNVPKCSITCSFIQNDFKNPLNSKLPHCDVEVLFHEFGHTLHTLLSRSNFQHLCGTRGPTDFIEIPSTLMENLPWNSNLLEQFAINPAGKPISNEMITNLRKTRTLFEGLETQDQIALALLDLSLHTTDSNPSNISPAQILSKIQQQNIGIQGSVTNLFLTSFNHLFYYGASYYSYLLAKDYSKRIWFNHFSHGDQLNREKGEYYRRNFLQPGASIDPSLILKKFIN
ncbi:hypothetical protein DICPUDRAFT_96831 [Dictyostelium purpureum]|uniref:Peptidase M3A/M3B catalytic domain-containing protein n=1 Tax=Dictyostelium purpureum TaxID=5786 RepID=F0ZBK2_DICPU|nr:uncharacterized protein DICPUDRAFT_96831 [Dictyostelium purpureum]EGC38680.1 hypothetical protein DICPUDRAFT_96831 [Dictyostelium purpureum]|eukprot:XP_003284776.1 hypothetical protein DICPUDRAFT_96831 [Dictyostelium purpureum]